MSGYGFLRSLWGLMAIGGIVFIGILALVGNIYRGISNIGRYRHQFGAAWVLEYEKDFERLNTTYTRMTVCAAGVILIALLSVWLFLVISGKKGSRSARRRRTVSHRLGSNLERNIIYRRKALVRIYFGLGGIVSAVALAILPLSIFSDFSNQRSLGIGIFVCGYAGVISGCSYWLKAKCWTDGVLFIGLMPLAILLIPYVRLVFVGAPLLLPVSMVMMAIILIVVVAVLPDRSGVRKP